MRCKSSGARRLKNATNQYEQALIPYLETYYSINYLTVSVVFISPVAGYALSAVTNNRIHRTWGQRGIAIGGPTVRLVGYLILCLHPPWGVFILGFIIIGYGNGLEDAAWNACEWEPICSFA